jgi:hypothetical protein
MTRRGRREAPLMPGFSLSRDFIVSLYFFISGISYKEEKG